MAITSPEDGGEPSPPEEYHETEVDDPDEGAPGPSSERPRQTSRLWTPLLVAPLILAGAGSLLASRNGLMVDPDSASFVYIADRIRDDPTSLFAPQDFPGVAAEGRWPPGYSVLLAATGTDPTSVPMRLAASFFAAMSAALVMLIVRRVASKPAAIAAALGLVVARGFMIPMHSFVLSDAMFMALALLSLWLLVRSVTAAGGARTWWAVGAGIASGVSLLTRYSGVAVVATIAVTLLMLGGSGRYRRVVLAVTCGTAPTALWLAQQARVERADGRQQLDWYGDGALRSLADLGRELRLLYVPSMASGVLSALSVVVLAAAVVYLAWSLRYVIGHVAAPDPDNRTAERTVIALLVFVWAVVAVQVLARLFLDPQVGFPERHTMPAVAATLAVGAILWDQGRSRMRLPARGACVAIVTGLVVSGTAITASNLEHPEAAYHNLAGELERSSLWSVAKDLPPGTIATNRGDFFYLTQRRETIDLPNPVDVTTYERNPDYEQQLRSVVRKIEDDGGWVAIFDHGWGPSPGHLTGTKLELVRRFDDGVLFECAEGCRADRT